MISFQINTQTVLLMVSLPGGIWAIYKRYAELRLVWPVLGSLSLSQLSLLLDWKHIYSVIIRLVFWHRSSLQAIPFSMAIQANSNPMQDSIHPSTSPQCWESQNLSGQSLMAVIWKLSDKVICWIFSLSLKPSDPNYVCIMAYSLPLWDIFSPTGNQYQTQRRNNSQIT